MPLESDLQILARREAQKSKPPKMTKAQKAAQLKKDQAALERAKNNNDLVKCGFFIASKRPRSDDTSSVPTPQNSPGEIMGRRKTRSRGASPQSNIASPEPSTAGSSQAQPPNKIRKVNEIIGGGNLVIRDFMAEENLNGGRALI